MVNCSTAEFLARSRSDDASEELRQRFGFTDASFRTLYLVSRHQFNRAPIFSVSEGLNALLDDTKVKKNIPIRFFAAPSKNAYIEFSSAQERSSSPFRLYASGMNGILEGCYIQETTHEKLPPLATEVRELLELDPRAPTRVIDIGFTASPLSPDGRQHQSIMLDTIDTIHLYIQDESEPFGEVLRRHQQLNQHHSVIANNGDHDLYEYQRNNVSRLSKILFYLSVEREERRAIKEQSDLEKRLASVADKKKPKIERMLTRTYDRIIVGPKTYTPIGERIASQSLPSGTKAPHYRSGYFGIRWLGTGGAKEAHLRRVKESIINEHLLRGEKPNAKDYELR